MKFNFKHAWRLETAPERPDFQETLTRDGIIHPVYSLRYTIWRYFMIFILVILLLLWLMQATLLETTYQDIRERYLRQTTDNILSNLSRINYKEVLDSIARSNGVCIEIVGLANNTLYASPEMLAGECIVHGLAHSNLVNMEKDLLSSTQNVMVWQGNSTSGVPYLLIGVLLSNYNNTPYAFLFVNTFSRLPFGTQNVLQEILIYITAALLAIGLLVSFFMARSIARPITQITKSAESLAQGNYNVVFDSGGAFNEAEQLANTLNYASTEISKIDTLRRDLMANISHDLRTPLTMVKAYAEMVRDISGDNPQKRNQHIQVIIQESDRLSALVNDILDLSRLESGNHPLELSHFPISQKLKEVLGRYAVLSEQHGYIFNLIPSQEVDVIADIRKLEQVIYNLINNAVNYSGDQKIITISQINKPNSVRIEITDNGPGIPPDQLPLIFDRYYRTEKSKREVIGTGLGLSIVKNILKQHNFPFGVQSELNKGSTFWFEITKQ